MPKKEIPRISMPSKDAFIREYIEKRQPAIITDMFKGQPIEQLHTMEEASRAFGDVKIAVRPQYVSVEPDDLENKPGIMTLKQYWEHITQFPTSHLLCTEYDIPAKISTTFTFPDLCFEPGMGEEEVFGLPKKYGDLDLFSNVFIAQRGNVAHLHFDGDQREVFLCQVFGRKAVILFEPIDGLHLKPFELKLPHSGHYLNRMDDESKDRLLEEANGYSAILHPGETVYIPNLTWHYLEYIDDAMSFNIRFKRNSLNRFLSVDQFHRDYYLQNFCCTLNNRLNYDYAWSNILPIIREKYIEPQLDIATKVKSVRALFRELCEEFCPDAAVHEYCPPSREDHDVQMIISDIGKSLQYAHPDVLRQSRPSGPISPSQKAHIEERSRILGWCDSDLEKILKNRLGKSSLTTLSRADAAQFMSYMNSPGAAL